MASLLTTVWLFPTRGCNRLLSKRKQPNNFTRPENLALYHVVYILARTRCAKKAVDISLNITKKALCIRWRLSNTSQDTMAYYLHVSNKNIISNHLWIYDWSFEFKILQNIKVLWKTSPVDKNANLHFNLNKPPLILYSLLWHWQNQCRRCWSHFFKRDKYI